MSKNTKRLRIMSDGTPEGTKVFLGEDEVDGVLAVQWGISVDDLASEVTLTVLPEVVNVEGDFYLHDAVYQEVQIWQKDLKGPGKPEKGSG